MTTRDLIEARLAFTRADLDEVIGRLDQSMMAWAPRDGMRTIAGQLVEIASCEVQLIRQLRRVPAVTDADVRVMIGQPDDLAVLKRFLSSVREDTLGYLRSLSDEELEQEAKIEHWSYETLGQRRAIRSEALRGIAQHEAYHTGQLVSYLWARGDNPYEWP